MTVIHAICLRGRVCFLSLSLCLFLSFSLSLSLLIRCSFPYSSLAMQLDMLLPLFNTVIADDLTQMIGSLSVLLPFLLYTAIRRPSRFRERNIGTVVVCLASAVYAFASYSNSHLELPVAVQLALSYITLALMLLFLLGAVLLTLWHFIVFKYIRHGTGITFGIECVFQTGFRVIQLTVASVS